VCFIQSCFDLTVHFVQYSSFLFNFFCFLSSLFFSTHTGSADKTIALWCAVDITPLGAISCTSCVGSLAFMGCSQILLAGVFNSGILGFDCTDGSFIGLFAKHNYSVWGLVYGMA
jgi:hypothetical protein